MTTPCLFQLVQGGSQVPGRVADAVRHYMCNNYVQLGAGYPHSDRADATVHRAHQLVKTFAGVVPCSIPGGTGGEVILGEFQCYFYLRYFYLRMGN